MRRDRVAANASLACLVLLTSGMAMAQDPAAPAVEFKDVYYALPGDGPGGVTWTPYDDTDAHPRILGRIEEPPLTGPQQIVWRHTICDIEHVERREDGSWAIDFRGGRLVMHPAGGPRRWECVFAPLRDTAILGFRTDCPW